MLGRIMELWRGSSLVSQMLDEFMEMLDLSKSMYDDLVRVGLNGGDLETIREGFFAKDVAINKAEQSIRRKVLVHLSVQAGTDIPACLVLISVVKDAERLGDYAKNIFEVFVQTPQLAPSIYRDQLIQMAGELSEAFDNAKNVFRNSDTQAAHQLREANYRLAKQCDSAIQQLLAGASSETAVAYALLFRFHKRILSHLRNIVSSVVMPVDKIGYFDAEPPAQPPA